METQLYQDIHRPLVDKCRAGDRKAQYELYKLYAKGMFNVCLRIVNDFSDAEDVLQESFLSAFQNIHSFKGTSTFGAWLKRIVVNHSISVLHKRKLNLSPLEEYDQPEGKEGPDEDELTFQVESIRRAIQQLPDGYRLVLSLYLLEGYDHQEIADILHITESTSKSQYSRARKKLLDMLKKEDLHQA